MYSVNIVTLQGYINPHENIEYAEVRSQVIKGMIEMKHIQIIERKCGLCIPENEVECRKIPCRECAYNNPSEHVSECRHRKVIVGEVA